MKKYKCYIVDDEPLALNVIAQHVARFVRLEVCGKTTESLIAIAEIKTLRPDLLFLDIEMPDLTGLELLSAMQHKPHVIITTAYRDFAVEGFEMHVLDYLIKPISFRRFAMAMDKFFEKQSATDPLAVSGGARILLVKADRKTIRVSLDQIVFIEGVKDYVKIVTATERILTRLSIGQIVKELPVDQFLQVHKSFVVAIDKITAYTAHDVEIGDIEIPIGRVYREEVLRRLG